MEKISLTDALLSKAKLRAFEKKLLCNYDFQKQPPEVFCMKISQNLQENCSLRPATLLKKESLVQVFCEISKDTFFTEHVRMTASGRFFESLTFKN